MTLIGEDIIPGRGIPNMYCLVLACRGDTLPIRRPIHGPPGYRIYFVSMTAVDERMPSRRSIPYMHCLIRRTRDDTFAIGRPCCRIDVNGMIIVNVEYASR